MAARVAQVSLFIVALLIGILLVGQLRSQARPIELSTLSAQELSTLIETLTARYEREYTLGRRATASAPVPVPGRKRRRR